MEESTMIPTERAWTRSIDPIRLDVQAHLSVQQTANAPLRTVLQEDAFNSMLYIERRRSERAQKRFVLALVDLHKSIDNHREEHEYTAILAALSDVTRETDIVGWYLDGKIIGVIGTEVGTASNQVVEQKFVSKFLDAFEKAIGRGRSAGVSVTFHFFPQDYQEGDGDNSPHTTLYPELQKKENARWIALGMKRFIDVLGSAAALTILSPVIALIVAAIKLTSKGPVLFKQKRLGQYGRPFTVFKFRSMRTDCDSRIHEQYVSQFIAGKVDGKASNGGVAAPVFKLQKDPRITPIGQFLRKTSLDELPQFWNVLRGDMSLVGPRPPIAYEFRAYDFWHRRRVLEIKPGITGLWQVEGRSRICFDDMVRLDLRYARTWSIWLDLRILLRTPAAVILGVGAH